MLYRLYLEADAPTLDEIARQVAADESMVAAPERDSIRRIIAEAVVPPSQADTAAIAHVLGRLARWDAEDAADRARELWVRAQLVVPVGVPLPQVTDPFALEVHRPLEVSQTDSLPDLPPYVTRGHDRELARVVAEAAAGASRMAVLVGGSSTGKSRACWEALSPLREASPQWRLWHPIEPSPADAVLGHLGRVAPYTVVWLNEAQLYLDTHDPDVGERVAAGLRELLRDPSRAPVLVLATLWPTRWDTLTTRAAPDMHAQARELLDGHVVAVPDAFTGADLRALAAQTARDPRLGEAAAHAGDGQIAQYLAGVPVLMDRYRNAPPATRALIWAAMDVRRLGCGALLPLALLAEAAPGYLTDREWEQVQASGDWLGQALEYVTKPCNGIPGILTPVHTTTPRNHRPPVTSPPASLVVSGRLYRLADFLDQHGRTYRADQIPPIDFWTAAVHAHPADLTTLGDAAWTRGLYRDAAQLHKNATAHGAPYAAARLVHHLHTLHPGAPQPAAWAAAHAALDHPGAVADLLRRLRDSGAHAQAATLLERNPAAHTRLDHPGAVVALLRRLRDARAHPQVDVLAKRAIEHVALDDPYDLVLLLDGLRDAGAQDQVDALLERNPAAHVHLDDPLAVAELLDELIDAGAQDQVDALLERNPAAHVHLNDPFAVAQLLNWLRDAGPQEEVDALLARAPAAHVHLNDPFAVALLVEQFRDAGAQEQIDALLARAPAEDADLFDPATVATLTKQLQGTQAHPPVDVLIKRAAAYATHVDPLALLEWQQRLRTNDAGDHGGAFVKRAPMRLAFDDPIALAELQQQLLANGIHDRGGALAERLPAAANFEAFLRIGDHRERFRFGREPNGTAAAPWSWEDLK